MQFSNFASSFTLPDGLGNKRSEGCSPQAMRVKISPLAWKMIEGYHRDVIVVKDVSE